MMASEGQLLTLVGGDDAVGVAVDGLLMFDKERSAVQQAPCSIVSPDLAQQQQQMGAAGEVRWSVLTPLGLEDIGTKLVGPADDPNNSQPPQPPTQLSGLPSCCYCGKQITDEYILRVLGEAWHANCLRCADCGEQLHERCYVMTPLPDSNEMPPTMPPLLCRRDFMKRSGARCPRCSQPLGEGDLVRKAQDFTFHAHCFACVACQRELITGQLFYVLADSTLLCKFHYETAKERQNRILAEGAASPGDAAFFAANTPVGPSGWGDAALSLLRGPVGLAGLCGGGLGGGHGSMNGADGPKRPRTTINSLQLELLRRAYETSSKPPRHVREQLSQETGLDMRVVQVWFQNKRAKEKRMRKDPSSSMGGGGNLFGGEGSSNSSANAFRSRSRRHNDDSSASSASGDSLLQFDDDAPDDYVDDG